MIRQLEMDVHAIRTQLTDFLRSEMERIGLHKAILGLSGGVDSALVAFLAVEALGRDNVFCMRMPYRTSSAESLLHAQLVIDRLGLRHEFVDITPMVDAVIATDPGMDRLRMGNIMARQRMIVLYDRSARERGVVLGTGNRTEILLGYSTLHGDAACALAPLGDLYKTQVWMLAEAMGIPSEIITKAPSADLWDGQTDEGELGFTYREVDELLSLMIDECVPREALRERGYSDAFVDNVIGKIQRNEFKRSLPVVATLR